MKLPQLPQPGGVLELAELQRRFYQWANQVYDFLRVLPVVERKSLSVLAPVSGLQVLTRAERPWGVLIARVYETADPSTKVTGITLSWYLSDDERVPGIVLSSVDGLTSGTDYTLELLVVS